MRSESTLLDYEGVMNTTRTLLKNAAQIETFNILN